MRLRQVLPRQRRTSASARRFRGWWAPGLPKPGWLLEEELAARLFFDRVDAVRIKGEMVLDRGDCRVRLLICPDGIGRALATGRNAVIGAVALVGAVGDAVSPLEQRHFDVLARDILHGRVAG